MGSSLLVCTDASSVACGIASGGVKRLLVAISEEQFGVWSDVITHGACCCMLDRGSKLS
jgi:hypothetical protein